MRTRTFTTLPFLAAFLIGLASMGLSIYDIHARELGTLDVGHRATRTADLKLPERPSQLAAAVEYLRLRFGDERGEIAVELLVPVSGIKALKQRAADLVGAMKQVQAKLSDPTLKVDAPEREVLRADLNGLIKLADANAEDLKAAERLAEFERTLSPVPDPDAQATARAAAAARIDVKENFEDDPKRGFKSHREFLQKVMDVGRYGMSRMDARLKSLFQATAGSDEQGNYSDPHGGFLQPVAFSPDILSVQADGDPTAALTRNLPMTAPMVLIAARVDKDHSSSVSGGLRVYRHAEATALTASRGELEKLTFQAHELIGLAHATETQISDSPLTFIAMIADGFRDEFGAKLLVEKIRGTGAGGQYLGALNSPAKIEVAKENGQKADTILVENIDKMAARCWRYTSERTVYLANPTTRPQLRGLVRNVGTGGSVVNYFTNEGGVERLDGRRIFFTEFASALGDAGDLILINLSEYLEGLYQGAQQAESIHVRFENHERSFKWWVRNCGAPWWSSVLTPKYGDTLSPIVTLAAR